MVVKRIEELISAKTIPASGRLTSGGWTFGEGSGYDVVVESGQEAVLLIADNANLGDLNIDVARGATLRILNIIHDHSAMNIAVAVAEDAQCMMTQVVVSASDTRVVASLMERGARFELGGVFVLTDDDQASVTVDVNHIASDCQSHTSVKGVAAGKSHGSFSGLVYVAPDAQRTDSVQSSRNITMGEAHIETLPQLEIYADDVKCSHGATVGQMDSDAILYMRQRGLSLADAKRLQIEGFVDDVVLHSVIAGSEEVLAELLAEKLNRL
ncbi:MAG: SufD family Fe-S cluster assembly protein [Alistipes sp.]|nr:SufD family Fe-S cluster assembly protein [Alistipes sp.]MBO7263340.1 SufD family Fe-S cluster assembly protein [Alistipes sp.]